MHWAFVYVARSVTSLASRRSSQWFQYGHVHIRHQLCIIKIPCGHIICHRVVYVASGITFQVSVM